MTVTEQAYISALEQKLHEAERALYGFRKIYEYWRSNGFGDVGHNQAQYRVEEADDDEEEECDT